LGPFITPLKEILQEEYGIKDFTEERIDIQVLFKALYNTKFLEQIPLVKNFADIFDSS
jgi:hypothetical protein